MSAIIYQLTATDGKGKVLVEEFHTSPIILAEKLPDIKKRAEDILEQQTQKEIGKGEGLE